MKGNLYNDLRPLGWLTYEESVELSNYIPEEFCDMYWHSDWQWFPDPTRRCGVENQPCWSLGALEKLLPKTIKLNEYNDEWRLVTEYVNENLYVYYDIPRDIVMCNKLEPIWKKQYQNLIDAYYQILLFLCENDFQIPLICQQDQS